MLALIKHAHWLKKIEKEKAEEENSFSESDDSRFRHPSNDKKKGKLVSPSNPRE